jgi:putative glycosyltransferase (TIGR04372 family)
MIQPATHDRIRSLDQIPKGASICIYGSGEAGRHLARMVRRRRRDLILRCFVDTRRSGRALRLDIVPLPAWLVHFGPQRPFVLIASQYADEISAALEQAAYPYWAVIDLASFPTWKMRLRAALDKTRRAIARVSFVYEAQVAPFLARHCSLLYWPLREIAKAARIRFIVNIAHGTGHVVRDLDQFLVQRHLGMLPANGRYVWLTKSAPLYKACIRLYRQEFYWARSSTLLYDLLCPMLMRFHDITYDAGSTQIKWQLTEDRTWVRPFPEETALNIIPLAACTRIWISGYENHRRFPGLHLLRNGAFGKREALDRLLEPGQPIALLHIKDTAINGTAAPTEPETYREPIECLLETGHQLVFVGREQKPKFFDRYPIFDYPRSGQASFENDLYLFRKGDVAIVSGGIGSLAAAMGTPFLYINSWHIAKVWWSRLQVVVPTLLTREDGSFLTVCEQMHLHDAGEKHQNMNSRDLRPRNATGEELLHGLQELLELKRQFRPKSRLQEQAARGMNGDLGSVSEARYSESFIKKFPRVFQLD